MDPKYVESKADEELLCTIPEDQEVIRIPAVPYQWTRRMGFGGIAWRAYGSLARAGSKLLQERQYHAVYFSSTVFRTFCLGPKWLDRFGIPYFIDYHDPWWTDYYFKKGAPKPPGGMFKYKITHWLARKNEAEVIRGAAGVTCVSPGYVQLLRERYPQTDPEKYIELPFGAPERDAELAGWRIEDRGRRESNKEVWRYIGAGGGIMADAVRIFAQTCKEIPESVRPEWKKFKIEFLGTSYATYGKPAPSLAPVLSRIVPEIEVEEKSERLPYLESLRQLVSADRLILFGTNDPGYTASKLGVYILARRPLLVICREESSVARIVRETRAGELITFGESEIDRSPSTLGAGRPPSGRIKIKKEWEEAMERWLAMDPAKEPPTDWQAFEPYTAKKMTEKLCRFFDERLEAEDSGFRGKGLRIEERGLRDLGGRIEDRGLRKGELRSEDRGVRDLGERIEDRGLSGRRGREN